MAHQPLKLSLTIWMVWICHVLWWMNHPKKRHERRLIWHSHHKGVVEYRNALAWDNAVWLLV